VIPDLARPRTELYHGSDVLQLLLFAGTHRRAALGAVHGSHTRVVAALVV
jgi:hypothetical protein